MRGDGPSERNQRATSSTWRKGQTVKGGKGDPEVRAAEAEAKANPDAPARADGGVDRRFKHPEVRAQLAALLPIAVERLAELLDSDDKDDVKFAIAKTLEYSLPKPAPLVGADELEKIRMLTDALRA